MKRCKSSVNTKFPCEKCLYLFLPFGNKGTSCVSDSESIFCVIFLGVIFSYLRLYWVGKTFYHVYAHLIFASVSIKTWISFLNIWIIVFHNFSYCIIEKKNCRKKQWVSFILMIENRIKKRLLLFQIENRIIEPESVFIIKISAVYGKWIFLMQIWLEFWLISSY